MLGQILLLHMLKLEIGQNTTIRLRQDTNWRLLLFFDVAAPSYLTSGVLLGLPAAVLTALLTQICVQGYTLWRGLISWSEASYRVATTALLVLLSTVVFQYTIALFRPAYHLPPCPPYPESLALIATLCASV